MRGTLRRGAALALSLLASGCASSTGGEVLFSSPEGGTVRIGAGRAHPIPWSTHLDLGSYPVEFLASVPRDSTGLSSGEDAVWGWLVVIDTWKGGPSEFAVTRQEWIDATAGHELLVAGQTPSWTGPVFRFKGSVAGVLEDDPDVEDWRTEAAIERGKKRPSKTVKALEKVGKVIVYAVAFVVVIAVKVISEDPDLRDSE
jgi:hypothetical protein